jgi:hypothetical protein
MDGVSTPSAEARVRLLSSRGEPLFLADWLRVLMMHFEVDPRALQRDVPFPLDLWPSGPLALWTSGPLDLWPCIRQPCRFHVSAIAASKF